MTDKLMPIDEEYLLRERRAILRRLGEIEDKLKIPRSFVPKRLRKPWKKFQEEHGGIVLDGYPEDGHEPDIDVSERSPH